MRDGFLASLAPQTGRYFLMNLRVEDLNRLLHGIGFLLRTRRQRLWLAGREGLFLAILRFWREWPRAGLFDTLTTWKSALELIGGYEQRQRATLRACGAACPVPVGPLDTARTQSLDLPPFLERRIDEDLARWAAGFSLDLLSRFGASGEATRLTDTPEPSANLLVEISNERPSFRILTPHLYNRTVIAFFLCLAKRYALPTTRLLINCTDWPVDRGDAAAPVFSFAKTKAHGDLLLPDPDLMRDILQSPCVPDPVPWPEKRPVGFFRGSLNGPIDPSEFNPRLRLFEISDEEPGLFDVGLTHGANELIERFGKQWDPVRKQWRYRYHLLLERYAKEPVYPPFWPRYRYILHLDGNTAAYRLAAAMRTGSVIVKHESPYLEYWYGGLVPNKNFVPVDGQLGDLVPRLALLRAKDRWAQEIARQGLAFAETHLGPDAVFAYVAALLHRYARLASS